MESRRRIWHESRPDCRGNRRASLPHYRKWQRLFHRKMFLYLVLSITYLSDNEVGVAIMPKKGLRPKLQFLVISKSINLIALSARAE